MATDAEVLEVSQNVNEASDEIFGDDYIAGLVDAGSVTTATLTIWRKKAARFAELVDVTEAGATHAFSDLHKNALDMVKTWQSVAEAEGVFLGEGGHPRVTVIDRE